MQQADNRIYTIDDIESLVSGTMSDDIEDTSDELASGQLQIEI